LGIDPDMGLDKTHAQKIKQNIMNIVTKKLDLMAVPE
jgi:hypothetical protein